MVLFSQTTKGYQFNLWVFSTTSQELKPLSKGHFEKTLSVRFEICDFGSAEVLNDILRHIYIYSVIKLNQDLTN